MKSGSRKSLYSVIQDYFIEEITERKLQPNDRIPTEKELMKQFDVSRITVSNALAGLAKGGWLYRIPGRGSFVAEFRQNAIHEQAAGLEEMGEPVTFKESKEPVKKIIGLILPVIEDFYAIRLNKGIQSALQESEYSLVIILSSRSKELEEKAIRDLIQMGVSGLIIYPVDQETYNEEILALKVQGFPFVLIDRYLPGIETDYVCSDNITGAQMAVSHLWELGHREIAVCSETPLPTATVDERVAGYMKELKARGAMINPANIMTEFEINDKLISSEHMLYQHIQSRKATAYLVLGGLFGVVIAGLAKKLQLRIPEDVSIICFDDPSSGFRDTTFLTHINQLENEMGRKAVEILLSSIKDYDIKHKTEYKKIIVEPQLVIYESTGPVPVYLPCNN